MASLWPEVKLLNSTADSLIADVAASSSLELRFQRLIAEVALLRLFYTLDNILEIIALKLLTNTPYCDGTSPALIQPAFRSTAIAHAQVVAARPNVRYIKWTQLSDTKLNLRPFLLPTEHFLFQRQVIDPVMEDMRHVRNHIAHGTRSTGVKFANVVSKVYSTAPRGISPGKLLLTSNRAFLGATSGRAVEQYLRWSKVAIKTLTKS